MPTTPAAVIEFARRYRAVRDASPDPLGRTPEALSAAWRTHVQENPEHKDYREEFVRAVRGQGEDA